MKTNVENLVGFIEKAVIAIILVATITAIMFEIMRMIEVQYVELADLLLLFIYVEVIGMVRVYYVSNRVRMTYPYLLLLPLYLVLLYFKVKTQTQSFFFTKQEQ